MTCPNHKNIMFDFNTCSHPLANNAVRKISFSSFSTLQELYTNPQHPQKTLLLHNNVTNKTTKTPTQLNTNSKKKNTMDIYAIILAERLFDLMKMTLRIRMNGNDIPSMRMISDMRKSWFMELSSDFVLFGSLLLARSFDGSSFE